MKFSHIDHIVLLVSDLERSRNFYSAFLGSPSEETLESFAYKIGETKVFFAEPQNRDSGFDKENIGLNHIAFHVGSLDDLKKWEKKLDGAGIRHSGIEIDKYGGKEFIWFDDPDGIRLEFYLR